jgi:hypothetical protein
MQVFLMHIGHPGHVDVDYTVKKRRDVAELLHALPADALERPFFERDAAFRQAFPSGEFHCWGIPPRAQSAFERTSVGDLVLIVPWIGIHDGGVHQIGVVKAKCPVRASFASPILWPKTPHGRPYPWLIFFDTEAGRRPWHDFLEDLGYQENWNPRGWYRPIDERRFHKWGGSVAYLQFLRTECGFHPL